jgi:hypothetical protein
MNLTDLILQDVAAAPPVVIMPQPWGRHWETYVMVDFCRKVGAFYGYGEDEVRAIAHSFPSFLNPVKPATVADWNDLAALIAGRLSSLAEPPPRLLHVTLH